MMARIPTKPLDDGKMWRKAVAATHPDRGGDHELCIWMQAVQDAMCNGGGVASEHDPSRREPRSEPPPRPEPRVVHEDGRVPFPKPTNFEALTARALEVVADMGGVFAIPLRYLSDCRPMPHMVWEQERGASYKRLAYVAHLCGMSKGKRIEWYTVAESIPLSERHASHVISKLKKRRAT